MGQLFILNEASIKGINPNNKPMIFKQDSSSTSTTKNVPAKSSTELADSLSKGAPKTHTTVKTINYDVKTSTTPLKDNRSYWEKTFGPVLEPDVAKKIITTVRDEHEDPIKRTTTSYYSQPMQQEDGAITIGWDLIEDGTIWETECRRDRLKNGSEVQTHCKDRTYEHYEYYRKDHETF